MRLATRGSALARWQANHVRDRIRQRHGAGLDVDIEIVRTTGDNVTDVPLAMIGDRGLFTKEVDDAVLDGRCDLAVHSLKDVPTRVPDGLVVAAVLEREDPRDAFVSPTGATLGELPPRARIGTSSLRRRALLLAARNDLVVEDLRGNLDTRIAKLRAGSYDGIVLALAGLRRSGCDDLVSELLDAPHWLPAAGQGALAIVARADDAATRNLLSVLDDPATRAATDAERAFLAALEGGCQVPIGALATVTGSRIRLHGLVASLDGTTCIRGDGDDDVARARRLGESLARELSDRGAREVLDGIRASGQPASGPPAP